MRLREEREEPWTANAAILSQVSLFHRKNVMYRLNICDSSKVIEQRLMTACTRLKSLQNLKF